MAQSCKTPLASWQLPLVADGHSPSEKDLGHEQQEKLRPPPIPVGSSDSQLSDTSSNSQSLPPKTTTAVFARSSSIHTDYGNEKGQWNQDLAHISGHFNTPPDHCRDCHASLKCREGPNTSSSSRSLPLQYAPCSDDSPLFQFLVKWNVIMNVVLQLVTIIAAFVFGAWAIKSYAAAEKANILAKAAIEQSEWSNKLALLALCHEARFSNDVERDQAIFDTDPCSAVFQRASLEKLIDAAFPPAAGVPSPAPSATSSTEVESGLPSSTGSAPDSPISPTLPSPSLSPTRSSGSQLGTTPTTAPSPTEASSDWNIGNGRGELPEQGEMSLEKIIGVVVGSVTGFAAVAAGVSYFLYLRMSRR
ncbi:hypothetical protein CC2G_007734 [Coprinopsis cinerea AmutBmut pab1-1]|nr:hypothetical protein CC2G_007734 [Coprinopsis cinerea AmutBmut pab1-1]